MDKKITQFPVAATIVATDLIPIVDSTTNDTALMNKVITAGVLSLNMPNVGNKGISKDLPVSVTPGAIPLTASVYKLSAGAYTLAAGTDGQTITLVASAGCTVAVTASTFSSATFSINGIAKFRFLTGFGWLVESSNSVSIA